MRTSLLAGLTTRGVSFLTAGIVATLIGYLLGERALLCVGIGLISLPLLAAFAARRGHYRLATSRSVTPPRVPIGHTATVTLRLENVSRVPTGLLLAEDTVPYALGSRPRYVLDKIERHGVRQLTYPLRSDLRGKFQIGPLHLRVADSFGLVELTRSATGRTTFVVTPRVVGLSRSVISRTWAGEGEGRARLTSTAGEDDVIPREYRDGDELRRVHWRSTARYGELMVRREEQRWRNRATIFLDTRSFSHLGTGTASSFETAVSAAASIGVHIAREGLTAQFVTDGEALRSGPFFADALLDALAVIRPSSRRNLDIALAELRTASGVIVAILGRLSVREARQIAATRTEGSQGLALLLDVSSWADAPQRAGSGESSPAGGAPASAAPAAATPLAAAPAGPATTELATTVSATTEPAATESATTDGGAPADGQRGDLQRANGQSTNGQRSNGQSTGGQSTGGQSTNGQSTNGQSTGDGQSASPRPAETAPAEAILRNAGWHVSVLDAATPIPVAWQRLSRPPTVFVRRPSPDDAQSVVVGGTASEAPS
jgi:uncharacterized protein (DUF58 family)